MKPWIRPMLLSALLAIAGVAGAVEVDVMVQNQYLGTDLTPVITSPPELLSERVVQALENVAASLPAERLQRLAGLIAKRQPHAVVLNEAFAYSCVNFHPATPATEGCGNQRIKGAFVDFLASTEANLDGGYVVQARVRNFAIEGLPFEIEGYLALLSVEDRDAILVRSDVAPMAQVVPLAWGCPGRESLEGCNYLAVPTIETALGPVTVQRGYLAVDMLVDESIFRVFGTHLELRQLVPGPAGEPTRVLQRLQAAELTQTALLFPAAPGTRTLIVGDINSAPTDGFDLLPTPIGPLPPPYAIFVGSGFTDAWTLRPGTANGKGAPLVGNSCCQDEDLANHKSALYERIDMIFSLDPPSKVREARLLGESVADKTWPPGFGVWPSDHASLAVTLVH